jgi:hypothetical protein
VNTALASPLLSRFDLGTHFSLALFLSFSFSPFSITCSLVVYSVLSARYHQQGVGYASLWLDSRGGIAPIDHLPLCCLLTSAILQQSRPEHYEGENVWSFEKLQAYLAYIKSTFNVR